MPIKNVLLRFLTVAFVVASAAFAVFAQGEPEETVTVETNLVVVNAVVTDANGKYVSGLRESDFTVYEDGKAQQITTFGAERTPFAAIILLDTSGSMERLEPLVRSAAIKFLEGLREEDVAAIYKFDSDVDLVQEFSASRDLVPSAFNIKAKGMTVLNDAIVKAAAELSSRPERRRAIIVLSDGADTRSSASGDKAIRAALAANATVYTVDMSGLASDTGRRQNSAPLKSFAEKSGGRFVPSGNGVVLREAFKEIVEELSTQYTIGYQPTNAARDGKFRKIEVQTARPNVQTRTRKGYQAPKK